MLDVNSDLSPEKSREINTCASTLCIHALLAQFDHIDSYDERTARNPLRSHGSRGAGVQFIPGLPRPAPVRAGSHYGPLLAPMQMLDPLIISAEALAA